MLILPDSNGNNAYHIIDRLRRKVENFEIPVLRNIKVKVTTSFGIASFPEDGTSLDDLLVVADERLYKSKGLGKNQITYG